MSEPTKVADEREDRIAKYVKRVKPLKNLLGRTRSNRLSVSSLGEGLGESSKSAAKPATPSSPPRPKAPAPDTTLRKTPNTVDPAQVQQWNNAQQEKARALFAKYGLTLEPGEWMWKPTNANIQRVEKPIRMRVRRNCHRCLTTFGADKVCSKCQHVRCKKCFRYPPPKPKEAKGKEKAVAPVTAPVADPVAAPKPVSKPSKVVLSIPSRTGGQDRIRRPIKMRIRRTCHRCSTLFIGDATECQQCQHIRCKKCPRDPPKLKKWPDGYPGDAEPPVEPQERVWRKPRQRVRWTCDRCSHVYSHKNNTCSKCNHERCKDCIRDPPKKIKPDPDPELLRRVEEKLAALQV